MAFKINRDNRSKTVSVNGNVYNFADLSGCNYEKNKNKPNDRKITYNFEINYSVRQRDIFYELTDKEAINACVEIKDIMRSR